MPAGYCGKCAIYTQECSIKTPVPYLLHYRLRGEQLKCMTRYEYSAIMNIIPISNSKPSTSGAGRKRRTNYAFDHAHPLYPTHCQVINLKFKSPILMGKKV